MQPYKYSKIEFSPVVEIDANKPMLDSNHIYQMQRNHQHRFRLVRHPESSLRRDSNSGLQTQFRTDALDRSAMAPL